MELDQPGPLFKIIAKALIGERTYIEAKGDNSDGQAVYLLRQYNLNFPAPIYKIGISNNFMRRVYHGIGTTDGVANQYPYITEVVAAYWPERISARHLESLLHVRFECDRVRMHGDGATEWFAIELDGKGFTRLCNRLAKSKLLPSEEKYTLPEPNWASFFDSYAKGRCFDRFWAKQMNNIFLSL